MNNNLFFFVWIPLASPREHTATTLKSTQKNHYWEKENDFDRKPNGGGVKAGVRRGWTAKGESSLG